MRQPRVLLTGGSGFLGQAVQKAFAHLQPDWHILAVPHHVWDIRRPLRAPVILQRYKPTYVVHLAGPNRRRQRMTDACTPTETPATFGHDMLQMDLNVIEACRRPDAIPQPHTLLCMGSVYEYALTERPVPETAIEEGLPHLRYRTYGLLKRTQLALLRAARAENGLNGIQVVLPNVFGPGDRHHVVADLIKEIWLAKQADRPAVIKAKPDATLSLLYVTDAAEALVHLLSAPTPDVVNLPGAAPVSFRDLVTLMALRLGFTGGVTYTNAYTVPIPSLDGTRLRQAVPGWVPTPFTRGLSATIAWQLREVLR